MEAGRRALESQKGNRGMSATQKFQELTYTMRPQDSSRRRRWDAISRQERRRLPRQHATSDHGDRRPGPAGRCTSQYESAARSSWPATGRLNESGKPVKASKTPALTKPEVIPLCFRFFPLTLPTSATSLPFVRAAALSLTFLAPLGHAHAFGSVSAISVRRQSLNAIPPFTRQTLWPGFSFRCSTLQQRRELTETLNLDFQAFSPAGGLKGATMTDPRNI